MPVKKPPVKPAYGTSSARKRVWRGFFTGVAILGAAALAWWLWAAYQKGAPEFQYILFEKNDEQIRIKKDQTLSFRPQDKVKILKISTNLLNNSGIRLAAVGFDVNALLHDEMVLTTLLPADELIDRYEFKVEVKHFNSDIGSFRLLIEPLVEDWIAEAEKIIDKNNRILLLERAHHYIPDDKLIHRRLLEEYKAQAKWLQAAALLEETAKDQADEKTLNDLLAFYENMKKTDEVLSVLRRLVKLNPQNTAIRVRLADLLEKQKKYPEAILEYEVLLKQVGPENLLPVYKILGFLYLETGRSKESIAVFLKAVELDKTDANLYHNLADLYAKENNADQAEFFLNKALSLKGDDVQGRLKLAESLFKKQKMEEAEKNLREVLDKDPQSMKALLLMAQLLNAKKDKSGLKTVYRKILALNPENDTVTFNLGILEYEGGDLAQAQNYFKIFAKNHPEDPEVHNLLFALYKKQNQDESALKEAQILIDLKPADPAPYRYIFDYLNRHGRFTEMIPVMQKALNKSPDQAQVREYLILAYLKTGQEDQALDQLKILHKSKPKDINTLLQLAKLQEKLGQLKEALASYQTVLDLDPDHAEAEEAYLRLKLEIFSNKTE